MALDEAAAWLDAGFELPIGGKKYKVAEPSAELGIRLEVLLTESSKTEKSDEYKQVLSDQAERDLYAELLGTAYQQMLKDQVSYPMLKLAAVTAMYHFVISPETAEQFWNAQLSRGKAAARSRKSPPVTRRTTGAASSTKAPASGSGTRSRRSS